MCHKSLIINPKSYPLYGVYSGGDHLFPFRTEKLSPPAQMVLGLKPGRVCRCQFYNKTPSINLVGVFCFYESFLFKPKTKCFCKEHKVEIIIIFTNARI